MITVPPEDVRRQFQNMFVTMSGVTLTFLTDQKQDFLKAQKLGRLD